MKIGNRDVSLPAAYVRMFATGNVDIDVVHEPQIPAPAWTEWDKEKLKYHIKFQRDEFDALEDAQFQFILDHEIGHIILGHCVTDVECNGMDRLVAADVSVNWYLRGRNDIIDEYGYVNAEQVMKKLNLEPQVYPFPVLHDMLHEKNEEAMEQLRQQIEAMCGGAQATDDPAAAAIAHAIFHSAPDEVRESVGVGQLPGTGSGAGLNAIGTQRPAWAEKLSAFASSIVDLTLDTTRTMTRPTWSYLEQDAYVPSYRNRWTQVPDTVTLLVDTSGSMYDLINQIGPTITYLNNNNIKVRIIAGDVKVLMDEEVKSPPTDWPGGGGTDIVPLFERANDYKPRAIVCFTDGYVARWPKDPGVPVLWVCDIDVPFGQRVSAK